jgi:hypothetical protein
VLWPNIPTALTPAETRFLVRLAAGKRVLEAGALLGFSTITMAKAGASVVSIDRHCGYGPTTLRPFLNNLALHGCQGVEVVVGDVREVELPGVDLAVLDLTGQRALTEAALIKVAAPWILLHDAGRQNCEGVGEAIRAQNLQVAEGVGTFALIQKKESSDG